MAHERDYLERTIATVRNHRDAENCWPQWANIFADEIERLWGADDAQRQDLHRRDEEAFDARAGIYLVERGILRRVAETSLKGVGDTLVCLRDEGQIAPDDCVGVLDQVERHWLLNPWVRPR